MEALETFPSEIQKHLNAFGAPMEEPSWLLPFGGE